MLFFTIAAIGIIFANGEWIKSKAFKIITGVTSFFIFVAGMGLIARIGIKHGDGFPAWISVKIGAWFIFNIGLILCFKVKDKSSKIATFIICLAAAFVASYSAITKLVS